MPSCLELIDISSGRSFPISSASMMIRFVNRRLSSHRRMFPNLAWVTGCVVLLSLAGCLRPVTAPDHAMSAPSRSALNHVYVVLDQETFAAIRQSAWVERVLVPPDTGLPDFQRPTEESDRLFLRGRQTYLEFFAPDNRFGEPVGKVGIGMGLDASGDLAAVEQAWRRAYGTDIRRTEVAFRRVDPPVPWYDAVQRDATSGNPHLVLWAMTYRPEFVSWQSDGTGLGASTRRLDAMASRWKAGQGLLDVVGITLAVPRPLHDMLIEQLLHVGLVADGVTGRTRLLGDGWYLQLRPLDTETSALESIDLAVASLTDERCELVVGRSVIEFEGAREIAWRFDAEPSAGAPSTCADVRTSTR